VKKLTDNLDSIADEIRASFTSKDAAREKVLPLFREVIRQCSQSIRAIHRQEFKSAENSLKQARSLLDQGMQTTNEWDELRYAGFSRDAQKEYAEGRATLAMIKGDPFPGPVELNVDPAAYLNGLGDAVGELRRYILDSIRRGDMSRSEELLTAMDDIYSTLITMDFPDAVTAGLRRTTDAVRGILERTRGDLTLTIQQKALEQRLREHKS